MTTTNALSVELASGDPLDVRDFVVEESLSRLFDVRLTATCASVDVDFEASIGKLARFEVHRTSPASGDTRYWNGICQHLELVRVEEHGLSTYAIRIVPVMWLLTQRRTYRVFQDKSELDVALEILARWGIDPVLDLDAGAYAKRRMRVQYGETDFDFVNRLLEEIGVTYHFEQQSGETKLVLVDSPNTRAPREPLRFVDQPNDRLTVEFVTALRTHREVRPGRYTQSDVDYRKALDYPLAASSSKGNAIERGLELYYHEYGSFLWKGGGGGNTPHADDRGPARTNEREGGKQVDKHLDTHRVDARVCSFKTSAYDLRPGKVITISGHPRREIGAPLLVVAARFTGHPTREWELAVETRYTDVTYRPPLRTPKPRTQGVESATVTGPGGEEIHTDEFGRVRVHFHWDREGTNDEQSSCWLPVNQPWAGAGFGSLNLPRVGQEVLVDFLGADPDRPVVIGRVFTTTTPPPYELPKLKMVSGLRSETYPRPTSGSPQARMGVAAEALAGSGSPSGSAALAAATQVLPGLFGGVQFGPGAFGKIVGLMTSLGPDLLDHTRTANGIVFDDKSGAERVYLQGQRDLNIAVKNNKTCSVGNNRAVTICGNDSLTVKGYQHIKVEKDRTLEITGVQSHHVQGDILCQGDSNNVTITKKNLSSETLEGAQAYAAKTGIILIVDQKVSIEITPNDIRVNVKGKSRIFLDETAILVDAPKVYINPGDAVMTAVFNGVPPAAAVAAQAREDRINTAAQKAQTLVDQNPGLRDGLKAAGNGGAQGNYMSKQLQEYGAANPDEAAEAARRADTALGPVKPLPEPDPSFLVGP